MEEKYIFNNKIYNITTSTKLYEYKYNEDSGRTWLGGLPMMREVKITIYRSSKGRLYKSKAVNGYIGIEDIVESELKGILIKRNEISLLKELYSETLNELEEV